MHQGNNNDSPLNLRLARCASYSRSEALILQKRAKHLPLTACLSGANPITPWYSWDLWLQTVTNICDNEINDVQCGLRTGIHGLIHAAFSALNNGGCFLYGALLRTWNLINQCTSSQLTGNEKVCGILPPSLPSSWRLFGSHGNNFVVQQSKILINLLCTTRFLGNPCVATIATHESPFYISSEPTRMSCCTSQLSLVQLSSTRNCTSPARGCKHHII